MFLKIGELARRAGLTVRALRHYGDIGLLVPSERSSGGYRLYDRKDVARLYRIQALRRLDLSLAEIGALLVDNDAGGLAGIVERQVAQLDREIRQASALRTHLLAMQGQLQASEEPAIDDWLVALESMVAGAKYFSDDELRTLASQRDGQADAVAPERAELTALLHELIASGASPEIPQSQALAQRWIGMLLAETGGDEGLLMKLYDMHWNEPSLHSLTGVDREGMRFISHAMAFARLQLYAAHCSESEMATLRAHYVAQTDAWPPLIAEVRQQMLQGALADSAAVRALALRWQALSLAKAGGDAALHIKLQDAFRNDAALRAGSGIDAPLAGYIGRAIAQLGTATVPSP
ncbi:DNA-binding transcriptional MerR regulator [Variovorax boronicumulans]|uniref:MerR family transcriptional regulator n=1 Tax=Variovorax boronicumulans TaxID=436515 RepID=UPI00278157A0|nr:MerR family transcriptional regulator [Variovorax boronicumulans]MDQ0034432.1 DNA-binding transcriptional MerR regulator [Variovorax boronicumulans]MDQ0042260.1 DNA-binding transcriptional MerR regulator [Variovorax boronicumulans]